MPTVYGILYSIHVILCKYPHDQFGGSIQYPSKAVVFVETYIEPVHDKTNKMTCVPSEDPKQPVHPPRLTRVFAVRSMGSLSLCRQRRF